jgi:hypothetical protein
LITNKQNPGFCPLLHAALCGSQLAAGRTKPKPNSAARSPHPGSRTGRLGDCYLPEVPINFRGPVPGTDAMAKGPQGWVKYEDHLPCYKDNSCSLPLLLSMIHGVFKQQRRSKNLAVVTAKVVWGSGLWKGRCLSEGACELLVSTRQPATAKSSPQEAEPASHLVTPGALWP